MFSRNTIRVMKDYFDDTTQFGRLMIAANAVNSHIKIPADLSKDMDVSEQVLGNWKTRGLPAKEITSLAERYKCSYKWLKDGVGPMHMELVASDSSGVRMQANRDTDVPLIPWVRAGDWKTIIKSFKEGREGLMEKYPAVRGCGERTYVLVVQGESMYNPNEELSYRDGEIIYVDPDATFTESAHAIVKLNDSGEIVFRKIIKENKKCYLKALNPSWPNRITKMKEEDEICGLIINKSYDTRKYNK